MKLADETYGQAWQMTITAGPDVNAEECGHWYSPTAVARMIEDEREVWRRRLIDHIEDALDMVTKGDM